MPRVPATEKLKTDGVDHKAAKEKKKKRKEKEEKKEKKEKDDQDPDEFFDELMAEIENINKREEDEKMKQTAEKKS